MVESKTTDKLRIICQAAQDLLKSDNRLSEKVKSISIVWSKIDGVAVPDIKIDFFE